MDPKTLTAILTIGIPALVSLAAAFVAGRSAVKARTAEAEAARLRQLEERIAQKKYDLYEPMLKILGNLFVPGLSEEATKEMETVVPEFMTFVTIWGSDDAVEAFAHFRIASNYEPPVEIIMRLVSDFLLAARRDLSGDNTRLTGMETIGMRVNDLYENENIVDAFRMSFEELAAKYEWQIPWELDSAVTQREA